MMDFKSNKIDISYPVELIESINSFPPKHVVPCSALVNNEEIGGIFIVCPPLEIKYFNIIPTSPPEPPLKFRKEADWFERNNKLVTKLNSERHEFEILSNFLKKQIKKTDRIFKYFNQSKSDFFVRDGGIQVVMGEISKSK